MICPACKGSTIDPIFDKNFCRVCNGSAELSDEYASWPKCPACKGTSIDPIYNKNICRQCKGIGRVDPKKSPNYKAPPSGFGWSGGSQSTTTPKQSAPQSTTPPQSPPQAPVQRWRMIRLITDHPIWVLAVGIASLIGGAGIFLDIPAFLKWLRSFFG